MIHNELRVFRNQFRRAGELLDAEPPGPLGIELVDWNGQTDWTLIVAARDVVPDWEAMRPA
jgi:hypothetical protein